MLTWCTEKEIIWKGQNTMLHSFITGAFQNVACFRKKGHYIFNLEFKYSSYSLKLTKTEIQVTKLILFYKAFSNQTLWLPLK